MLIEFMGLPGGGKTTLYNYARSFLENEGHQVLTNEDLWKRERIYYRAALKGNFCERLYSLLLLGHSILIKLPAIICFISNNVNFIVGVIIIILTHHKKWRSRFIILKYFFIDILQYSTYYSLKGTKDSIVLFDEGFVHHIFTYLIGRKKNVNLKIIKWYRQKVPLPNLIVYVPTSPDICLKRMRQRGLPYRFSGESFDVINKLLIIADGIYSELYEFIKNECPDTHILQLKTNSLEKASYILLGYLQKNLG